MSAGLLLITVALLPLLVPRGPGGTAPLDVTAVLFVAVVAGGVLLRRRDPVVPAALPIGLVLLATAVALAAGPSRRGVLIIVIEVYLVALLVAAADVLEGDPRLLRQVLAVWTAAAVAWAALVVGAHYDVLPAGLAEMLSQRTTSGRPAGAARNPNMMASYLSVSAFVALASPWPRRSISRWSAVAFLCLAVWATGSNGALIGMAVGAVVLGVVVVHRRLPASLRPPVAGTLAAVTALAFLAVVVTSGIPQLSRADIAELAERSDEGAFSSSLGRLDHSVDVRWETWSTALRAVADAPLTGVGPGQSFRLSDDEQQVLGRDPHNDALSMLVERGIPGLLGFLLLVLAGMRWAGVVSLRGRRGGHDGAWDPAPLGPALVCLLMFSLTHEIFHFRHFWLLLAVLYAARGHVRWTQSVPEPLPFRPREELSLVHR